MERTIEEQTKIIVDECLQQYYTFIDPEMVREMYDYTLDKLLGRESMIKTSEKGKVLVYTNDNFEKKEKRAC